MARPKAVLLPCGLHFGPLDQPCQMCAEIERAKAVQEAANTHTASRPDPTRAVAATAAATAVTAVLGTGEPMIRIHDDIEQGTEEWFALRRGMVTASSVASLISVGSPDALTVGCPTCLADAGSPCVSLRGKTPTPIKTIHGERSAAASNLPPVYSVASGDTAKALTLLLVAERIAGWTDPTFTSFDMQRGHMDEPLARAKYAEHFGVEVTTAAFIVRSDWGFSIGYSPDGLVRKDGTIEIKSRRSKKQVATVLDDGVPAENMAQIQTGLLVSGREWCDYVSYCGGLPMWTKRVYPDPQWQAVIIAAVATFEANAARMIARWNQAVVGLPTTERIDYFMEIE